MKNPSLHQHKIIRIIVQILGQYGESFFIEALLPLFHRPHILLPERFQLPVQSSQIPGLMVFLVGIGFQNGAFYPVFLRVLQYLFQIFPPVQIQVYLCQILVCFGIIGKIPDAQSRGPDNPSRVELSSVTFHGRGVRRKNLIVIHQLLHNFLTFVILFHLQVNLRHFHQDADILPSAGEHSLTLFDGKGKVFLFPETQIVVALHPDQMDLAQSVPVFFLLLFVPVVSFCQPLLQQGFPDPGHGDGILILALLHIKLCQQPLVLHLLFRGKQTFQP